MDTQCCTRCNQERSLSDFTFDRRRPRGRTSVCKQCETKRVKQYAERNREKVRTWYRRYQIARYGLTSEQYDVLWERQRGLCGICEDQLKPGRTTHIDHDHQTGHVRGLLCQRCNQALGLMRDKASLLIGAAMYLRGQEA